VAGWWRNLFVRAPRVVVRDEVPAMTAWARSGGHVGPRALITWAALTNHGASRPGQPAK
jgi:hypothetical protein